MVCSSSTFKSGLAFGSININYCVGVDGLSIWLLYLTAFIMPLAVLFSLGHVKERLRLYYSFLLLIEFAMMGVFVAQDLFLFYIFWEVSLVPMYFGRHLGVPSSASTPPSSFSCTRWLARS
ncbi:MAG: hypothetical protein U0528_18335 [Anaerolineae bacterium]